MEKSDYIIIILFGLGSLLISIFFIFPESEFLSQQSQNFSLNCNITKTIPIYLNDNAIINGFLSNFNSSVYQLHIYDPLKNNVKIDLIDFMKSSIFKIDTITEGFYIFEFSLQNCNYNNEFILFSYIVENLNKYNTADLFSLGTIMLSFASGYILNIFKDRFNPYKGSPLKDQIPSPDTDQTDK